MAISSDSRFAFPWNLSNANSIMPADYNDYHKRVFAGLKSSRWSFPLHKLVFKGLLREQRCHLAYQMVSQSFILQKFHLNRRLIRLIFVMKPTTQIQLAFCDLSFIWKSEKQVPEDKVFNTCTIIVSCFFGSAVSVLVFATAICRMWWLYNSIQTCPYLSKGILIFDLIPWR